MGVGNVRRFHMLTGPESLFEHASVVLEQWTVDGVNLGAEHIQQRLAERTIDGALFDEFDASEWQIVTCDVTRSKQKKLCYVTARKPLDVEREQWLWAVFVHEYVVTAWIRKNASIQRIAQDMVTKGDIWNAVDRRYRLKLEKAAQLAEQSVAEESAQKVLPLPCQPRPPGAATALPEPEQARQPSKWERFTAVFMRLGRRIGVRGSHHG